MYPGSRLTQSQEDVRLRPPPPYGGYVTQVRERGGTTSPVWRLYYTGEREGGSPPPYGGYITQVRERGDHLPRMKVILHR